MQRISTLLQKLTQLSEKGTGTTILDIDLMMDYTRVLYADLLEMRKTADMAINQPQSNKNEAAIEIADEEHASPKPIQPIQYTDVPVHDIRTMIGINDKYLFITELFSNDKSAYDQAIKTLNSFTTSAEATMWVERELVQRYNWDAESETTKEFYTLLNSCFSSI